MECLSNNAIGKILGWEIKEMHKEKQRSKG
jgi:hypothetical protein